MIDHFSAPEHNRAQQVTTEHDGARRSTTGHGAADGCVRASSVMQRSFKLPMCVSSGDPRAANPPRRSDGSREVFRRAISCAVAVRRRRRYSAQLSAFHTPISSIVPTVAQFPLGCALPNYCSCKWLNSIIASPRARPSAVCVSTVALRTPYVSPAQQSIRRLAQPTPNPRSEGQTRVRYVSLGPRHCNSSQIQCLG